jgi:hypothetical protein
MEKSLSVSAGAPAEISFCLPHPRMRAFKFIKVACRQDVESTGAPCESLSLKGLSSGAVQVVT